MTFTNTKTIIAIQADPIHSLKTTFDSSLFIASQLIKKGFVVFFYTPDNITIRDSIPEAKGEFVDVTYEKFISNFVIKDKAAINLRHVNAILIRQDPPFNMDYITNTYILEKLAKDVPKINNPVAIRNNSEKMICFNFSHLMPPTILTHKVTEEVIAFIDYHKEVVMKPLYWFGGKNINKVLSLNLREGISIINEMVEKFGHIIIQKFIHEIYEGDKRIIVINGKAEGVLKRIPQNGNFIANIAAGGLCAQTEITHEEHKILDQICPYLLNEGIILAGIDIVANKLLEINVTSPTGLVAIDKLYGINLAKKIVEYIEAI